MSALLHTIREASVTWALAILLIAAWLLLNATLDGPSETDALQASADIDASLAAMHVAAKDPQ